MIDKLKDRFKPVLTIKSFHLFSTLVEYVEKFEINGKDIICYFPDEDDTWIIEGPATFHQNPQLSKKILDFTPKNYQTFLSVCGGMLFGEAGDVSQVAFTTGFEGTFNTIGTDLLDLDDSELNLNAIENLVENLFSPIDMGLTAFYYLNPNDGQFYLCDEVIKKSLLNDPIEIYLKEIHFRLKNVYIENSFKLAEHRSEWLVPIK